MFHCPPGSLEYQRKAIHATICFALWLPLTDFMALWFFNIRITMAFSGQLLVQHNDSPQNIHVKVSYHCLLPKSRPLSFLDREQAKNETRGLVAWRLAIKEVMDLWNNLLTYFLLHQLQPFTGLRTDSLFYTLPSLRADTLR